MKLGGGDGEVDGGDSGDMQRGCRRAVRCDMVLLSKGPPGGEWVSCCRPCARRHLAGATWRGDPCFVSTWQVSADSLTFRWGEVVRVSSFAIVALGFSIIGL